MLAFINLLPIPMLDGGHITFLVYEIIAGRPPSDKFLMNAQVVGLVIVLCLFMYSNGLDILRGIGCEVIELDCNLDWNFPKYNPNPEDLEMLHEIAKVVKENNADIGFGFDGDGDRVGVIDNKGNEIFSDKIGLLIARNLSGKHKNSKFVVDVKSTGLYSKDKILLENKCETIYWKTGHSHIKRKVNTEKALAGFEKSGHFFFNQGR